MSRQGKFPMRCRAPDSTKGNLVVYEKGGTEVSPSSFIFPSKGNVHLMNERPSTAAVTASWTKKRPPP